MQIFTYFGRIPAASKVIISALLSILSFVQSRGKYEDHSFNYHDLRYLVLFRVLVILPRFKKRGNLQQQIYDGLAKILEGCSQSILIEDQSEVFWNNIQILKGKGGVDVDQILAFRDEKNQHRPRSMEEKRRSNQEEGILLKNKLKNPAKGWRFLKML